MESTNPNLLELAPRTGLEAIDRILDGLEKGHTGVAAEYCYEANGVCCPIGSLLTSEQRKQIAEAGLGSGPSTSSPPQHRRREVWPLKH